MKSSKLKFLVVANLITIVFPLLVWMGLALLSKFGHSGTEFIALMLIPFLIAGYGVAIFNVVTLISYLRRQRVNEKRTLGPLVALLISILFIIYPIASWIYSSQNDGPRFTASVGTSVEKAADLINSCSLKGVSFVELLGQHNLANAENSATGIVSSELEGSYIPHTLFVSSRARSHVEPLLQNINQRCPEMTVVENEEAVLDENRNWLR